MSKILSLRGTIVVASTVFAVLVIGIGVIGIGLISSIQTRGQQVASSNESKEKDRLIQTIEQSTDQLQRVVETDDSPLRIREAKVKVITGTEFTLLSGKATDLPSVSSVPETTLFNVSDKTITGFMLVFRDPRARNMRTLKFDKLSISPGQSYVVSRGDFVSSEKIRITDDNGTREVRKQKVVSERYWITMAEPSQYFIAVGIVEFGDGTRWIIREGGEVQ